MNTLQSAFVKSIRAMSDEQILELGRANLGSDGSPKKNGSAGGSKAPSGPRKPRTTIGDDLVDAVEKFVHASTGVAVSEVAAGCKIDKSTAALCLKKLREAGRVKVAGERRFARYAKNIATARTAEKAARTPALPASEPAKA